MPETDLSGDLRLTVRRWKERRSLDANGYMWALITKIAQMDGMGLFDFVPFQELLIPMVVVFGAAGMFVGIVGSWTSIRKFMDV